MPATRFLPGGVARAQGVPLVGTLGSGVAHRTTLIENQGVSFYLPADPVIESLVPFGPSGRRDWAQVDVLWDFGDGAAPTSSVWAHSGKPQDEDTGITAAHVYETAGSYTATCTIRVAGVVYIYSVGITVSAFSGTELYFNPATGNDAWDGTSPTFVSGTTGPKASIQAFRTAYLALSANTRINLVGGQTHTVTSSWTRSGAATFNIVWRPTPSTGTPTISISGCTGGWIIGGTATENTVFHDIDAIGTPTDAFTRPGKNWTFLRCRWTGLDSGSTTSDAHGNKQFVFYQEVVIDEVESYGIYFNHGQRCGILGCTFNGVDEISGEHLRRTYLTQSVEAHNRDKFPRDAKLALKFVGYFTSSGLLNKSFDADTDWTHDGSWTISGGQATHTPGSTTAINQPISNLTVGDYRACQIVVSGRTVGSVTIGVGTGTGAAITANGTSAIQNILSAANTTFSITPSSDFDGSITLVSDTLRAGTEGTEAVIHSCIHDNVVDEIRNGNDWVYDLGPIDNSRIQITQDCFCYNNVMSMSNSLGDAIPSVAIIVRNEDWTLYNNVVDVSQIPTCDAVRFQRRGVEPVPTRCRAYNTTVYCSVAFTGPAVTVTTGCVDCEAYNTLLVRPSGGTNLSDSGTGTLSGTNVTVTTGLVAPGGIAGNYAQSAGSGGLGTGTLLPRAQRYRNGTLRTLADVGADAEEAATTAPTVTTDPVTDITSTSADCGGNVTSDGGSAVTERGVCWNTTGSPTTADSKATSGTGTGAFDADPTGLTPSTTYFIRAYAINGVGTSYGAEASFTTSAAASYTPPASSPAVPILECVNPNKLQAGATLRLYRNNARQGRQWLSVETVDGAATGIDIETDGVFGYPLEIPQDDGVNPPQLAATLFLDQDDGSYPLGAYSVSYDGDCDLTFGRNGSGSLTHNGAGTKTGTFTVNAVGNNGISLTITRMNAANPLRNLKIHPPDAPEVAGDPFHAPALEFFERFAGTRNLDSYRVNNKTFETSSASRKPSWWTAAYSYATRLEDLIALHNRCGHRVFWWCFPELIEQDLATEMGATIAATLNSDSLIVAAVGNEHWNGDFGMKNRYIALGGALWPSGTDTQKRHRYYARRCAEIFRWFEDGLGPSASTRLIKALEGQASAISEIEGVQAAFSQTTITDGAGAQDVNPHGVAYQAIEIHPYLGAATAGGGTNLCDTVKTLGLTTVPEVIALIQSTFLPNVLSRVATHKTNADAAGKVLIAGECGINAVGTGANLTDAPLNALMHAALDDRDMFRVYREYMEGLRGGGVKLTAHYSAVAAYTNGHSYALKKYLEESSKTAWRFRGYLGLRGARVPLMMT